MIDPSLHMYTRKLATLFILLLISLSSIGHLYAAEEQQYKIGDKLQKEKKSQPSNNNGYQNMDWDSLSPSDWDPLAALKGLDLDNLDDADPEAMEALTAVGESWKNAPIIPSLNGKQVRISGFVVPLDINKQKVKELLLVPYFGACIHIPPPPSNQTIHAVNRLVKDKPQNQILKDAALIQGPVVLLGVLEATASNTQMGAAGYKLHIDKIEAYKE